MARLPTPGGDNGNWGTVLNDYLSQSHKPDGSLRADVANIADLKALDVTQIRDKMQALVGGYYTHGDGGGGQFYYDRGASDADNGGTILAPTAGAGRWKRIYGGAEINVRWFGAKGDGATDDTAAIQAAASGGDIFVPPGNFRHGPIAISKSVRFLGGSSVTPIFTTGVNESLYEVTSPNVTIEGLNISGVSGTISANKYIVRIASNNCRVKNICLTALTASDGIKGSGNLKVIHGVYVESSHSVIIEGCTIAGISGAAIFLKEVSYSTVRNNHITNTRWYSINADHTCHDIRIEGNTIDGDDIYCRYYGGSINLMSQHPGAPNNNILILNNKITGVHNYGSCIRLLSLHDSIISGNIVEGCVPGVLMAGERLQYIGVDRRIVPGTYDQGNCTNLIITDNNLRAGLGSYVGIYIKNQHKPERDPFMNISVIGNIITSPSSTHSFESGIIVHGFTAGFVGLNVRDNILSLLTVAGSIVAGGIGVVSSSALGEVSELRIEGNIISDIVASTPASAFQTGIYIQGYTAAPVVRGNTIKNFFYGVRTGSTNVSDPSGLNDNTLSSCTNDTLFPTMPFAGGFNMSMGTELPVKGVFTTGHIRQKTNAAASASWGWVVTAAGGAMTAAWASGQTYVAGTWYRNGSGRVYELVTSGGGTTADAPASTTVGELETGADGYVWRCRAPTSARWAALPALGVVEVLP